MAKRIWSCKIGEEFPEELPPGSDGPMREAVQRAYREITGVDAEFIFSGWNGALDEVERRVVMEECTPLEDHKKGGPTTGRLRRD